MLSLESSDSSDHGPVAWLHGETLPVVPVAARCELTDYPIDCGGNLLHPLDADGAPVDGWWEPGNCLPRLTYPGRMDFVLGSEEVFASMDFAIVNAGPRGMFVVFHLSLGSDRQSSRKYPANTAAEKTGVARAAFALVDEALSFLASAGIQHSQDLWLQNPAFFPICVSRAMAPHRFRPGLEIALGNTEALAIALEVCR